MDGNKDVIPLNEDEIKAARVAMCDRDVWRALWYQLDGVPDASPLGGVDRLQCQAIGYAWGWQDRGPAAERDTGDAIDFGRAYAIHAAQYALSHRGSRHTIQDAWRAWVSGVPIADCYSAPDPREVTAQ